ncbi:molecular chaperone DnaJ [Clostridium sp. YIM B02500]|uniref:molecular chaperone DnaJ n=1 Tax=Clostridium sp. YIM B02500 TaxID=2910681 RepID=UPI001EEF679A|nr:molecular chaperone DnaJ [Clostridium sp. YIM B02500]
MTDYHKLLGIEKNASKEEIKKAYEMQVEKIKKEVVNEKRLNQFLKIFDEAYEALISLEENQSVKENLTVAINPKEIQKEKDYSNEDEAYTSRRNSKSKAKSSGGKSNNLKRKETSRNKERKNRLNDDKEEKGRKQRAAEKKSQNDTKKAFNLVMLPFKILVFPFIVVLSVIIAVLQVINIISWIATKVLIVGSISVGAIHLYQVKMGQAINYNILILAGAVLVASFFLPYILKLLLKVLQTINDVLKGFVF